jgi:hypothetical protein
VSEKSEKRNTNAGSKEEMEEERDNWRVSRKQINKSKAMEHYFHLVLFQFVCF